MHCIGNKNKLHKMITKFAMITKLAWYNSKKKYFMNKGNFIERIYTRYCKFDSLRMVKLKDAYG